MSIQRMVFVRRAVRVRAFIRNALGEKSYEWRNWGEPMDIWVASTSDWYGPRDWSPRKHKRGDMVLGEVGDPDEIQVVVEEDGQPERIWGFDPFWVEGALVIIPVLAPKVSV